MQAKLENQEYFKLAVMQWNFLIIVLLLRNESKRAKKYFFGSLYQIQQATMTKNFYTILINLWFIVSKIIALLKSNDHRHFLDLNAKLLCRFQLLTGLSKEKIIGAKQLSN